MNLTPLVEPRQIPHVAPTAAPALVSQQQDNSKSTGESDERIINKLTERIINLMTKIVHEKIKEEVKPLNSKMDKLLKQQDYIISCLNTKAVKKSSSGSGNNTNSTPAFNSLHTVSDFLV